MFLFVFSLVLPSLPSGADILSMDMHGCTNTMRVAWKHVRSPPLPFSRREKKGGADVTSDCVSIFSNKWVAHLYICKHLVRDCGISWSSPIRSTKRLGFSIVRTNTASSLDGRPLWQPHTLLLKQVSYHASLGSG
ncbi:hypothetical protein BX600DRAFT_454536 [Xylariales sp. PMI_506]|nr:hypothetical protein BX600DRAFT_454536 [Xylariales sp. PMI_506]